jgi:hypothetical protein
MTAWGDYGVLECYICRAAVSELADECPQCGSTELGRPGGKFKIFFVKIVTVLIIIGLIILVLLGIF